MNCFLILLYKGQVVSISKYADDERVARASYLMVLDKKLDVAESLKQPANIDGIDFDAVQLLDQAA